MSDHQKSDSKKSEQTTKPILHSESQMGQEQVQESAPPDGLLLKRMQANPQSLNPHQVLQLQRMIGNRATARLLGRETKSVQRKPMRFDVAPIQAKLQVGPANDKYEQEADQIADTVMRTPTPVQRDYEDEEDLQMKPDPTIQRMEDEEEELQMKPDPTIQRDGHGEGFAVDSQFEQRLQRANSGLSRSLPPDVQDDFSSKVGADTSGVQVHSGPESVQLNQEIGAKAFTHGKHIHTTDPSDGRLMRHETVHTIQQGASPVQRKTNKATVVINHTPTNKLQRLASKEMFQRLAGAPSEQAVRHNSKYVQILNTLEEYHGHRADKNDEEAYKSIKKLKKLIEKWLGGHTKWDSLGNRVVKEKKDLRKEKYLRSLKRDVDHEKFVLKYEGGVDTGGGGSSLGLRDVLAKTTTITKQGEELSEKTEKMTEDDNTKYQFSVLAAIENQDYLDFAEARLHIRIQEQAKIRGGMKNEQIKQAAAEEVVSDKYSHLSEREKLKKIKELKNMGSQVGHTWLKLETYDKRTNKQTSSHSFGFWPLEHFNQPTLPVPGRVRYPDLVHEADETVRRQDHEISFEKYKAGMKRATDLMKSPPDYKLVDFNCTKFAYDISQKVGATFPEKSFMRVPKEGLSWTDFLSKKGMKDREKLVRGDVDFLLTEKAYNPNALYEALGDLDTGYDTYTMTMTEIGTATTKQITVKEAAEAAIEAYRKGEIDTRVYMATHGMDSTDFATSAMAAAAYAKAKAKVDNSYIGYKDASPNNALTLIGVNGTKAKVRYSGDGKRYEVERDRLEIFKGALALFLSQVKEMVRQEERNARRGY